MGNLAFHLRSSGIEPNFDIGKVVGEEKIASGEPDVRYLIGDEFARGGMGAVLLADDINLRRTVAMKRLLEKRDNRRRCPSLH